MANGDGGGEAAGERVARLYGLLRPHLDERQRRLLLGAGALELGRGGIKAVAEATGVHPDTVGRGVREAEGRPEPRVRAPGGVRKKLAGTDPGLAPALMALVDPATRGDPVSPLRWTCLSTRNLAGALTKAGHRCSAPTPAGPTPPGPGPGRWNSPGWPPRPGWRSPSATTRPAPPSGTRSSTGCSPRSPATGAAGR